MNFENLDYENAKKYLKSVNWNKIFQKCSSIDEYWNKFIDEIYFCANNYFLENVQNDNYIFQFANSLFKKKKNILTFENKNITDNQEKADLFNKHFCSIFSIDNNIIPHFEELNKSCILNVIFTKFNVIESILSLKSKKSAGIDNIPPIFYKKLVNELSEPLSIIFMTSFLKKEIPSQWKISIIVPVLKDDNSYDISNYRPISITCVASRIMEKIIYKKLLEYFLENNLINKYQYGFIPGKSITTQLMSFFNLCHKGKTDIVYLDFCKAFDSIIHSKLIYKLEKYGVDQDLKDFCNCFLSNRYQVVKVGNKYSTKSKVISGIPQGTVLGPLFFIIYINDIINCIKQSHIMIYADNIKLFKQINNVSDYNNFKKDIENIFEWSKEWQLNINIHKCYVLKFSHLFSKYEINNQKIKVVEKINDLGLIITNKYNYFRFHYKHIIDKSISRINILLKHKQNHNNSFLINIFIYHIRPILETNSEIWNPYSKNIISKIENVQKYFTRRLNDMWNKSYNERLKILNLELLESRRIKKDLVFIYKIINNHIEINFEDFFIWIDEDKKIISQKRKKTFFSKSIFIWNNLDVNIKQNSLFSFKKNISTLDILSYLNNVYR